MLSDAEQRRLAEIESSLLAEDPAFVHRFDTRHRSRRRRTIIASIALTAAVASTAIAMAAGSIPAAVIGLIAAGATVGLWATRRGV